MRYIETRTFIKVTSGEPAIISFIESVNLWEFKLKEQVYNTCSFNLNLEFYFLITRGVSLKKTEKKRTIRVPINKNVYII